MKNGIRRGRSPAWAVSVRVVYDDVTEHRKWVGP